MAIELNQQKKALLLFSGGCDSIIAARILQEQNIKVILLIFDSPFFESYKARKYAKILNMPYLIFDFTKDIIEILKNPLHGFGKNLNPCIDCHGKMLSRACEIMDRIGAHFVATGEVLNERPMSQNRQSLNLIATLSGRPEFILRPLSAKLLPVTYPEKVGWIDRSKLLSLHGRHRRIQLKLVTEYGIKPAPTPAGGCKLTDPSFCVRLKDLMIHEGLDNIKNIKLLKYGRHFRLGTKTKAIIGRNKKENEEIKKLADDSDIKIHTENFPGPLTILPSYATEDEVKLAGSICARYSDCPKNSQVKICVDKPSGTESIFVLPAEDVVIEKYRL